MVFILSGFTVLRARIGQVDWPSRRACWSSEAGRPGELFGQLVDGQAHVVAESDGSADVRLGDLEWLAAHPLVEVLVLVIALLLGAGETDVLGAGEHIVHLVKKVYCIGGTVPTQPDPNRMICRTVEGVEDSVGVCVGGEVVQPVVPQGQPRLPLRQHEPHPSHPTSGTSEVEDKDGNSGEAEGPGSLSGAGVEVDHAAPDPVLRSVGIVNVLQ